MNVTFERVTGLAGLENIKQEWEIITDQPLPGHFFYKWSWYKAFLVNLSQYPENIHFVLMFDDGIPIGIFPYERSCEIKKGIKFNIIRFPSHPHLNLSDIITSDKDGDCAIAFVDYFIRSENTKWDVLVAAKLLEDSLFIKSIIQRNIYVSSLQQTGTSAYIRCDANCSHLDKLSPKFHRNIKRLSRRAVRKGALSYHYIRKKDELPSAFENFLRIESSGWKGQDGAGSAISLSKRLTGFYADIMNSFAQFNECQINLIKLDNKCIGAQFCLVHNKVLHILKIGYDERFRDISPGSLLLFDLIRHSIDHDYVDVISFVTGPQWAKRWHAEEKKVYRVIFANKTVKGNLYKLFLNIKNKY